LRTLLEPRSGRQPGRHAQSTITFDNVTVPVAGTYQMEIDYMTQGQRSFFISVNGNTAQEVALATASVRQPVP
jgi:alpha-galactosidase